VAGKEKKKEGKKPEKTVITPELRRIWLRVRSAWNISLEAFSNTLSLLNDKQAAMLYNLVKKGLFKDFYSEILREHPELRDIVKSDDDRLCMIDIYQELSWRLDKSEPLPPDVKVTQGMKGRIGRDVPDLSS